MQLSAGHPIVPRAQRRPHEMISIRLESTDYDLSRGDAICYATGIV